MKIARAVLAFMALAMVSVPAYAQTRHHDPLSEKESDELREAAQEPDKRLKLLVKYTRARMAAIEQLRNDPKLAEGRGQQLHDLLDDFTALIDEVDDNIDDYSSRQWDMRKGLKEVVEADGEFQNKLKTIKETGVKGEEPQYAFILQNAIEAVSGSRDNAQKALQEQEDLFKKQKKEKKK